MIGTLLGLREVWAVLAVLVLIGLAAGLPEYPGFVADWRGPRLPISGADGAPGCRAPVEPTTSAPESRLRGGR